MRILFVCLGNICRSPTAEGFDYIVAMDRSNLSELTARRTTGATARLALFMSFAAGSEYEEVPDPYYGGVEDFERVLDLCEAAARGLLGQLQVPK
jgi:protein-tyrosine phosphatase